MTAFGGPKSESCHCNTSKTVHEHCSQCLPDAISFLCRCAQALAAKHSKLSVFWGLSGAQLCAGCSLHVHFLLCSNLLEMGVVDSCRCHDVIAWTKESELVARERLTLYVHVHE